VQCEVKKQKGTFHQSTDKNFTTVVSKTSFHKWTSLVAIFLCLVNLVLQIQPCFYKVNLVI